jgi:hypothetical protein
LFNSEAALTLSTSGSLIVACFLREGSFFEDFTEPCFDPNLLAFSDYGFSCKESIGREGALSNSSSRA